MQISSSLVAASIILKHPGLSGNPQNFDMKVPKRILLIFFLILQCYLDNFPRLQLIWWWEIEKIIENEAASSKSVKERDSSLKR